MEYTNDTQETLPQEQPEHSAPEQKEKVPRHRKFYKDMRDILVIITVFMLVYVLFFRAVVVVGNSMYDTLNNGDRLLLISNMVYTEPERGDIIVASKDSFRNGECIVKRVIAVGGDTVHIDFDTGTVFVNGEELQEEYVFSPAHHGFDMESTVTVPEGCVFVMGDNRMDSLDSRSSQIGMIDEREILGKVIFLLFPGQDKNGERDFGRIGVVS